MTRIVGIDPYNMVIDVLAFFSKVGKCFSPILTYYHIGIDDKYFVDVFRVTKYFLVIIA